MKINSTLFFKIPRTFPVVVSASVNLWYIKEHIKMPFGVVKNSWNTAISGKPPSVWCVAKIYIWNDTNEWIFKDTNVVLQLAQYFPVAYHHSNDRSRVCTVYPKKYAHGFVVLCFVVVMQSFIMNSHEVFFHIHQGCFAGTGAIVRLPQC